MCKKTFEIYMCIALAEIARGYLSNKTDELPLELSCPIYHVSSQWTFNYIASLDSALYSVASPDCVLL
jgi:hypothetical protein